VNRLIEQLKRHEGFRSKPYKDTVGKTTIGYGRNLTDVGVSQSESNKMLLHDVDRAKYDVINNIRSYTQLDQVRRDVLINMSFNLGINKLLKFKNMLKAINDKNFYLAAIEMLDSKWAKQVGSRAIELADQMSTGKYK